MLSGTGVVTSVTPHSSRESGVSRIQGRENFMHEMPPKLPVIDREVKNHIDPAWGWAPIIDHDMGTESRGPGPQGGEVESSRAKGHDPINFHRLPEKGPVRRVHPDPLTFFTRGLEVSGNFARW